jgi:predicted porin
MKKSLIAAAVAGVFAAPAAMAEVTISGAIAVGVSLVKSSSAPANTVIGTTAVDSLTQNKLQANYSNINIASTDDIGNGNKIIFNYQLVVNVTSTGGNPVNRNSYLGVAGTWGAFKMGTNENVYERFMYQADPLDGAVGTGGNLMILGTPGLGTAFDTGQSACGPGGAGFGCIGFYRRTDQTIWYESPNFNGITFEVDYTLSAFKTSATGPDGAADPTILSVGAKWQPEGMPFYIDAAIEQHDDLFALNALNTGTGTSSSDDALQIGGGYTLGDLALHVRFEKLSYEISGNATAADVTKLERDAMWFAVKYNLPSGYVGAEIGIADEWEVSVNGGGTKPDTGATMIGVGYFHNLSKQSQLQFIYGRADNDANATYIQAGSPSGCSATECAPGSDHQTAYVGIKHTF